MHQLRNLQPKGLQISFLIIPFLNQGNLLQEGCSYFFVCVCVECYVIEEPPSDLVDTDAFKTNS